MAHIVITAETGCDVPAAEAAELGVELVPMHVTVGSRTIDDGEISPAEMLEQCRQFGVLPKTSGCTPHDFEVAFDRIHAERRNIDNLHYRVHHLRHHRVVHCPANLIHTAGGTVQGNLLAEG